MPPTEALDPFGAVLDFDAPEVPRFIGLVAPIAVAEAELEQARSQGTPGAVGGKAVRLARILAKRGAELGRIAELLTEAHELGVPDLLRERVVAYRTAGDREQAHRLFEEWLDGDVFAECDERGADAVVEFIIEGARLSAQLGSAQTATRALKVALKCVGDVPERRAQLYQRLGALGFWNGDPHGAADAYLLAGELGETMGGGQGPMDSALRALELVPERRDVAESLARKLAGRGRAGAADAILRGAVRRGGAAERAAFHQRRFQAELAAGRYGSAFGAALEAELDVEMDLGRTKAVLAEDAVEPTDFESFLVFLATHEALGDTEPFGLWMVALIEAHSAIWGEKDAQGLRSRAQQRFALEPTMSIAPVGTEGRARELRQLLAHSAARANPSAVRDEVARLELFRGSFRDAFEAIEPNLSEEPPDISQAALRLFVASRGSELGRARSLASLARHLPGPAAAEMGAVAAEWLARLHDGPAAMRAADQAAVAGPTCERALVAQATVALSFPELASPGQLESSLSVAVARAETCSALAQAATRRSAHHLALTWAERALTLRPTDIEAHRLLLEVAAQAADARRLAEAIVASAREFLPIDEIAQDLAQALRELSTLEHSQAVMAAEMLLESAPGSDILLTAIIALARTLVAPHIEALAIERQLAQGDVAARPMLLKRLADARLRSGEVALALRAFRAAGLQDSPIAADFLARAGVGDIEPEARFALMRLEVERPRELGRRHAEAYGQLLLRQASANWDMAQSPSGALDCLLAAAPFLASGYHVAFEHLVKLAGPAKAGDMLLDRARRLGKEGLAATLTGLGARAALLQGQEPQAFELAEKALADDPLLTDVLAVAERSFQAASIDRLEALYDRAADGALGAYGDRAVRYRAARFFEKRSGPERALGQAQKAFETAPSEGAPYVLMVRLASLVGDYTSTTETLERVSQRSTNPEDRERWATLARSLNTSAAEANEQRVDVLLRSLDLDPGSHAFEDLTGAVHDLLADGTADRDALKEKLRNRARGGDAALSSEGAARAAVAFARIALGELGDVPFAYECIERAVQADLTGSEYHTLNPYTSELVLDRDAFERLRASVLRLCQDGRTLGRPLAELLAAIAEGQNDLASRAELLVCAATDAPDDAELSKNARDASQKAGRSDLLGVIEGLLPADLRARSILSRASSMPDQEVVDSLLEIDLAHASVTLRADVLEVLGRVQEKLGLFADARDSWRDLHDLVPKSAVALAGLERAAERDEDYEELLRVLTWRAELAEDPETARPIHLRRAAVLETHLGRPAEARDLLEGLLERHGDSWAALRLLADSLERSSDYAKASELWFRAQIVATDVEAAADACFRAAFAYYESGEPRRARDALRYVDLSRPDCLDLKLKVERALGDQAMVMETLIAMARARLEDREQVTAWLLEAAEIARKLEAFDIAEVCAKDILKFGAESADARLLLVQLEVRRLGKPQPADATRLLDILKGTEGLRGGRRRELRAFLLAALKEALEGPEAGRRELEKALQDLGLRPLLAIGLAERLTDDPSRALKLYEAAAGGDFLHMRAGGDVLLKAGGIAREMGEYDRAQALFSAVPEGDTLRSEAARQLEQVVQQKTQRERDIREQRLLSEKQAARSTPPPPIAEQPGGPPGPEASVPVVETPFLESATQAEVAAVAPAPVATEEVVPPGDDKASAPASVTPEMRAELVRLAREADARERAAAIARENERSEREHMERTRALLEAEAERDARAQERRNRLEAEARLARERASVVRRAEVTSSRWSHPPGDSVAAAAASLKPNEDLDDYDTAIEVSDEEQLILAFEAGDLAAGQTLFDVYMSDRARSRDALAVASHLALRKPWDPEHLGYLITAATRDGSEAVALAARHVLGAFGAGDALSAPPLEQVLAPADAVQAVLRRGTQSLAGEVLALVWENASALFRKEASAYGISGVARVPLGGGSPLAELYRTAARILGAGRTPLFRGTPEGGIDLRVLLMQPPGVLLSGEMDGVNDELRFHLGAMLLAAAPEYALLFGASREQVQLIVDAAVVAFGPAERTSSADVMTGELAARLWETIPARVQRRLSVVCADPQASDLSQAFESARYVLRRAGLLVCGNIRTAVEDACYEAELEPPLTMADLEVCAQVSPHVVDLLALAVSAEYAEIRFRVS